MTEVYFSKIRSIILKQLETAEKEIFIAVYWFTDKQLFQKLCEKLQDGVQVSLVIYNDLTTNGVQRLNFQRFIDLKGELYFSSIEKPMHHKYCVIDEKTLINGSYNWTYNAERINEENILVIREDSKSISAFRNNFLNLISGLIKIDRIADYSLLEMELQEIRQMKNNLAKDVLLEVEETGNVDVLKSILPLKPDLEEYQEKIEKHGLIKIGKLNTSLGVAVNDGKFLKVLKKGDSLPKNVTDYIYTSYDYQTSLECPIIYGEHNISSFNKPIKFKRNNKWTNSLKIDNLPPLPKGQVKCKITFDINVFGTLRVGLFSPQNILIDYKIFNGQKFFQSMSV